MYENNELIIKRVINGYHVEAKEQTELNPDAVDGITVFNTLGELIGFIAGTYGHLEDTGGD